MPISKPYPHIYRHNIEGTLEAIPFMEARKTSAGKRFIRSYDFLIRDLLHLLEYIEPEGDNLSTYSQRTFDLLLKACTEIDANCKQILRANNHPVEGADIIRFSDLNGPMKLSHYNVICNNIEFYDFFPFESFADPIRRQRIPSWYRACHDAISDREHYLSSASLSNVIESIGAVFVILSAQYGYCFEKVSSSQDNASTDSANFFHLQEIPSWSSEESYRFDQGLFHDLPFIYENHPIPEIP
ncbi:MAG: hypothetical protein ACMUIE_07190 [Thermoplasmatota archaeon]